MATAADVEQFTRFLVKMSGIYDVDQDGYVINRASDDLVVQKDGNKARRIMIFKESVTDNDAIVINPLSEHQNETLDARWLYTTLSVGLSRRIIVMYNFVVSAMKLDASGAAEFPASVVKFLSQHSDLTEAHVEHFNKISKDRLSFMNVFYVKKLKEARLRCSLFDPDITKLFPAVSKKAWVAITKLMADLLGLEGKSIDEMTESFNSKYRVKSDSLSLPKLESILKLYLIIYERLNPYLLMADSEDDEFVPDISELGTHISKLHEYLEKARWSVGILPTAKPSEVTREKEILVPVGTVASSSGFRLHGDRVMSEQEDSNRFTIVGGCGIPTTMNQTASGIGFGYNVNNFIPVEPVSRFVPIGGPIQPLGSSPPVPGFGNFAPGGYVRV